MDGESCIRCGRPAPAAGSAGYLQILVVAGPDGEPAFSCPDCMTEGEVRTAGDYIIDIAPERGA